MDEKKIEQDQLGQDQEKIEKAVEKGAKNVIRETARLVGKAVKKLAKEGFKKLFALIGWKGILIILAIILVIILLAGLWFLVKDISFDSISSTVSEVVEETDETGKVGQVSKITTINEDERILSIDTEELEERLDKWFEENSVSKETLGIGEDYSTFEKFLEAEAVTSYPDLRTIDKIGTEISDDELQGCVQFHRYYSDGASQILEYMKYEDFSKKVAELGVKLDDNQTQEQIYTSKDDVEKYYNEIKDKFTLDENNNLIIAGLYSNETVVEYSDYAEEEGCIDGTGNSYSFNIKVEKINFQSVIQKYSMPFELCLALLMATDNPEFCEEVAELAKNSKIIIDVQDNITTTVIKDSYSYVANFKVRKYKQYKETIEVTDYVYVVDGKPVYEKHEEESTGYVDGTWEGTVDVNNYVTTTNTIISNNIQLCIREIDTWIANYKSTYSNDTETNSSETTFKDEDDAEFSRTTGDFHGYADNITCELPSGAKLENESVVVQEKKTDKKTVTTITTNTNNYNMISSQVKETPEKFLSLLKINPETKEFDLNNTRNNTEILKYEDIEGIKVSPVNNLLSTEVILYELLSSNSKTVKLEDTMRYLIGLYKGTRTLDESRFSMYEPTQFHSVISGIYSGTIQEKVWFALKDLGYTDVVIAGAMGNIDYESAGFTTTAVESGTGNGIGLCQWSFGRRSNLENYAAYKGVPWQDEDTQVEFLIAEITGQGPASEYSDQRISGYIGNEGITSTINDWEVSTNISDATLHFMRFFESPQSTSSLDERIKRSQKYLTEFEGREAPITIETALTGVDRNNLVALITEAIRIANDDRYQYSQELRNSEFYYDCSSFVSRLYEKYLGVTPRLDFVGTGDRGTDNIRNSKRLIRVDMSSLESGDILWKDGHVALYIGNGQIAEAKGTDYGIIVDVLSSTRFTEAYRLIM